MDKRTFTAWLEQLKQLSPSQWEQLHTRIEQSDASAADRLLEAHPPARCPHCDATHLIRWGSAHGLPRYRCTTCGRRVRRQPLFIAVCSGEDYRHNSPFLLRNSRSPNAT